MSGEFPWLLVFGVLMIVLWAVANVVLGNKNDKIKAKLHQLHQMIENQEGFKASHCLLSFLVIGLYGYQIRSVLQSMTNQSKSV
jgi:hypothetical protein